MKKWFTSRRFAKVLALCMAMVMCLTYVVGCTPADPGTENPGTENPGTTDPGTDTPGTDTPGTDTPGTDTPGTDTPGTDTPPEELSADLSQYTLISAADASETIGQAVALLAEKLKTYANAEVATANDTAARTDCEIVVGKTSVEQAADLQAALTDGQYTIAFEGKRIFLLGYEDEDVAYAVTRFLQMTTGYHADKYENLPIEGTTVLVTPETGKTMGQLLESDRVITEIEPCYSEPRNPAEEFYTADATEEGIFFTASGSATWKGTTEDGSYRVQMTVESRNDVIPQVYLRVNSAISGVEQVQYSIQGDHIYLNRATYGNVGRDISPTNPKLFTMRLEVHPEAGRVFYYLDGVFLGELNVTPIDSPLEENSGMNFYVEGHGIDVVVRDIYIEEIDGVDERRYEAVDIEIGDEEVYPESENAPAQTIYVMDIHKLQPHDRLTALTLQGLVNRGTPELFMDFRAYNANYFIGCTAPYNNEAYLDILKAKGRELVPITLEEALVKYADFYQGMIIGDCFANNYNENVATSLCGVLDGIYMTVERYESMKDTLKKDILFRLDNRFASSVDAYMWLWENYGDQFSKTVLFHTNAAIDNPLHAPLYCRDYAVMSRAFTFAVTDVQTIDDYDFYMEIFASTAPNTPVIGFGQGKTGFLEGEFFALCGRFGKYFTYGFACANLSLLNSLEVGELKQKEPEQIPTVEDDTMYITYVFSEGDNLSWDMHLWLRTLTEDPNGYGPKNGKGYSICGGLYYVAPALMEYFYAQASPNDYFFLDGGGISNLASPDEFAHFLEEDDREAAVTRMLELTEYVAGKTDISVLRAIANVTDEMAERYVEECPSIQMLISAYGSRVEFNGGTESYSQVAYMVDDLVRCRTYLYTFNRTPLTGAVRDLLRQGAAKDAPGGTIFAPIFVLGNDVLFDLSQVDRMTADVQAATDKKVVVLRPDVFAQMYAEYAK